MMFTKKYLGLFAGAGFLALLLVAGGPARAQAPSLHDTASLGDMTSDDTPSPDDPDGPDDPADPSDPHAARPPAEELPPLLGGPTDDPPAPAPAPGSGETVFGGDQAAEILAHCNAGLGYVFANKTEDGQFVQYQVVKSVRAVASGDDGVAIAITTEPMTDWIYIGDLPFPVQNGPASDLVEAAKSYLDKVHPQYRAALKKVVEQAQATMPSP